MARSTFSPSPSPGFESESRFSDSSLDDEPLNLNSTDATNNVPSSSRPESPLVITTDGNAGQGAQEVEVVECQWEECGKDSRSDFRQLRQVRTHTRSSLHMAHRADTCKVRCRQMQFPPQRWRVLGEDGMSNLAPHNLESYALSSISRTLFSRMSGLA